MNAIVDSSERAAALDPLQSFCVRAPAGSGKTELLIQRYLSLLSRVARPEQVLAITFTRKAAAEMRERVLLALQAAIDATPCDGAHEEVTRELALAALATDQQNGWHLLRDITRLNIKTIDSFCAGLTRQMPVLSQLGGQANVEDDVQELYLEAVAQLFAEVGSTRPYAADIAALMTHFDNNWERLQELLVTMLARREQWQGYVGVHYAADESERHLVLAVETLVREELGALYSVLLPYAESLLELAQYSARNLDAKEMVAFPQNEPEALGQWRELVKLLLTKGGTWRKTVTKREGFPTGKGEAAARKEQLVAILNELREIDGLEDALGAINYLPQIEAGSQAWNLVLHLSRLLPVLSAHLLLTFRKHAVVDHSQIAQSALVALGADDEPTDLALRLDYNIEHILVDEFQDTAVTQFDLLQKLTRGWGEHNAQQPESPRTLFIVGDGMQSIYAFRGANVGLLLKAQLDGFNGVTLAPLELSCNFRSYAGVVTWVNATFAGAFPAKNNANRAEVKFSPAVAVRPAGEAPAVTAHMFSGEGNRNEEVAFVCEQIQQLTQASEEQSIAVLGRSRAQLQPIISGLKLLGIPFHAQDLDSLARSSAVADLLNLCRVLANHADRLAWMALLRAPWCGLSLADLLAIARWGEEPRNTTLWSFLEDTRLENALSKEGGARLQYIRGPLRAAYQKRDRLGLRVWLEKLWLDLGGPASVCDEMSLLDAENFFLLLEEADMLGIGLDIEWLQRKLEKRYMAGGDAKSQVQIMTLHKAKGLEFDHVVIPQTDKTTRGDSRDILLWDELSDARGNRSFLLAADDRADAGEPTLYNYLAKRRKDKSKLETTRLFYVGATRAIRSLSLTGCIRIDEAKETVRAPASNSLLHSIWPRIEQEMVVHTAPLIQPEPEIVSAGITLMRLDASMLQPLTPCESAPQEVDVDISAEEENRPEDPNNHIERVIGTVVHLALEQLSLRTVLPERADEVDQLRWRSALQAEGLWGEVLDQAMQDVMTSVQKTLATASEGRWVLSTQNIQARSEWPLTTTNDAGQCEDIVIDRSFIDPDTNTRWVIDYKNSQPQEGQSLDAFFASETKSYRGQLAKYCEAVRCLGDQPVRCALFFTGLGKLHQVGELDLP